MCSCTWRDDGFARAGEVLGPNSEGDGALEVLAVVAHRGDEVSGDVLIQPPCLAPCNTHRSLSLARDWF